MLCNFLTAKYSKMISIRDIYQWDISIPKRESAVPLTPLQEIEFNEQNSTKKFYEEKRNKSFEGEWLKASPAIIWNIQKDKLIASSMYYNFIISYSPQTRTDERLPLNPFWVVHFEIFYDESFYQTIKLIYNRSMVEVEGQILKFSKGKTNAGDYENIPLYSLQLKLSAIKIIKEQKLFADYLDDKYKIDNKSSKCFIATAAFGNQDITEVLELRDFRDNILKKSSAGRFFITIYCLLSPPVAYIIRQNNWLRKLTRFLLRKVILPITKQITISQKTNINIA